MCTTLIAERTDDACLHREGDQVIWNLAVGCLKRKLPQNFSPLASQ